MSDLQDLRADCEQAERAAAALQAEKDELVGKLTELRDRQQAANQRARDAQKALCDGEVVAVLLDRPDGEALAGALGLPL